MSNFVQPIKPKKKRTVRLVVTEPEIDRIWAAVKFISLNKARAARLGCSPCWVNIDEIGDFLKKRQIDAHRVDFDPKDPSTRYALPPDPVKLKKWDDPTIVYGLTLAQERGFLKHMKQDGDNFFVFVPEEEHDLWKLQNTTTPSRTEWQRTTL